MNTLFERTVEIITSTRDLKQSLNGLQKMLHAHLGVEKIFMGRHLAESKQVCIVLHADRNESYAVNKKVNICTELHEYLMSPQRKDMSVYPSLGSFPGMAYSLTDVIPVEHSLYEFRMKLDEQYIGMIGISVENSALHDDALALLNKLRNPLSLAFFGQLQRLGIEVQSPHTSVAPLACEEHGQWQWQSPPMRTACQTLEAVAPTECSVLFMGETGVGKEVFARRLHALSPRRDGPFVHVNCGALPESLVDSELFGHKKGAFTGAHEDRMGFFEQAQKGTIFLDEVGELPLSAQTRLLLVLQNKTIRRVGAHSDTAPLDIRIVAATNRNLEELCRERRFRDDLLYRLNGVTVHIPPLRARRNDIPLLTQHLSHKIARELNVPPLRISSEDMRAMMQYDWPGNVRELENFLRRACIFPVGGSLRADMEHCLERRRHGQAAVPANPGPQELFGEQRSLHEHMRAVIMEALFHAGGRIEGQSGAAALLQIHPNTLRSRMKKLGIPFGRHAL